MTPGQHLGSGCRIAVFAAAAIGLASAATPAIADTVTLRRTDTGQGVAPSAAEAALARSGLFARLPFGQRLAVHGLAIAALADSAVYVAVSSEYIALAVLEGRARAEAGELEAGMVAVQPARGGALLIQSFDAAAFLATASPAIDAAARRALEEIASRQRRAIFWGVLEPSLVNVQAPLLPSIEAVRRTYLVDPAVVQLRRETGADSAALRRRVAERFVAALVARDAPTVQALLHPTLFTRLPGRSDQEWAALRGAFARDLVDGPLPDRLRAAQIADGDRPNSMRAINAAGRTYRITLAPHDVMLFVTAVERAP